MIVNGVDMSSEQSLQKVLENPSEGELIEIMGRGKIRGFKLMLVVDIEQFDVVLNERLRNLYAQVDAKTLEVTELRRKVPVEAVAKYKQKLKEEQEILNKGLSEYNNENGEDDISSMQINLERLHTMQSDYSLTLQLLRKLKDSIPEEHMELDKLQETINYLQSTST